MLSVWLIGNNSVFDHSAVKKNRSPAVWSSEQINHWYLYRLAYKSSSNFFTSAKRATGRFLMFPAAKASERTRARLVSPAKNRIKWRHFGANHLCPSRMYRWVRVQFRAAGTGHEKRRTFRESSIYIETCILQARHPEWITSLILYCTWPVPSSFVTFWTNQCGNACLTG